jgi:hypothetical protein
VFLKKNCSVSQVKLIWIRKAVFAEARSLPPKVAASHNNRKAA